MWQLKTIKATWVYNHTITVIYIIMATLEMSYVPINTKYSVLNEAGFFNLAFQSNATQQIEGDTR